MVALFFLDSTEKNLYHGKQTEINTLGADVNQEFPIPWTPLYIILTLQLFVITVIYEVGKYNTYTYGYLPSITFWNASLSCINLVYKLPLSFYLNMGVKYLVMKNIVIA